jgi:poly(hydroxyalkanoate) granule-associated protein
MVKKTSATPTSRAADMKLADAVRDSAQQIWLAGLGAFAKAQDEGTKVFETLVKEGSGLQRRTKQITEGAIGDVTGKVGKVAGDISKQATEGWDKLEQVFEDRVSRALNRLGVPNSKELAALEARIDALTGGTKAGKASKPAAKRAVTAKRVAAVAKKAVTSTKRATKKPAKK